MKIRNGFVSNSSTSSFVIVGIDSDNETIAETLGVGEDEVWEKLEELGFDNPSETSFYGKILFYGDNEGGEEVCNVTEMVKNLKDYALEVSEKLKVDIKKVKVYSGICAS